MLRVPYGRKFEPFAQGAGPVSPGFGRIGFPRCVGGAMRFIIQMPVIVGMCGLLWLSAELNAIQLNRQLFPHISPYRNVSLAVKISGRLNDIRQEFNSEKVGRHADLNVSVD